jgi:predicted GNAT family N-acyltransferase
MDSTVFPLNHRETVSEKNPLKRLQLIVISIIKKQRLRKELKAASVRPSLIIPFGLSHRQFIIGQYSESSKGILNQNCTLIVNMNVKCKPVKTINEFIDAIRLRVDVFIKEQGFQPGWEPDEDDKTAKHFIAMVNGKIVATARYRKVAKEEIKIERMVTHKDYRGKEVGTKLLHFMLDEIKKSKPKKIWVRSQVKSQLFYEKCGFVQVSEPFDMWGVQHIDLVYPTSHKK